MRIAAQTDCPANFPNGDTGKTRRIIHGTTLDQIDQDQVGDFVRILTEVHAGNDVRLVLTSRQSRRFLVRRRF